MKALEGKVVVLGSRGVGKTSLITKFINNKYSKELEPTIGATFFVCKIYVNDVKVKLHIWDTAGQERFKAVAPMYYRNANAAILVFDLCQYLTFKEIKSWVQELHRIVQDPLVLILVGNKLDLKSSRTVSRDEAYIYASSIGAKYFETSAEQNIGLMQVFLATANDLLHLEKENKCTALKRHDSNDSVSAYGSIPIEHDESYSIHSSNNDDFHSSSSYHSSRNLNYNNQHHYSSSLSSSSIHLPAVQMGIPVDENPHVKVNDIGRLETASWSIDSIAHGNEERSSWCC